MATQGLAGLGIGGLVGWAVGPGVAPVALAGGLTDIFNGAIDHYSDLREAEREVEYARNTLNGYYEAWQRCDTNHRNHTHGSDFTSSS